MDPLSAFGLAVNVLSVVDISKSFLETLGQVKDAGSSAATRDIASIGRSLQASSAKIASQSLTTGDDEAFKDLVDECMNLSKELIDLGEELSVASSGKLMTKVKITARSMWSHSKIQEKKARLEAIRGQLLFDIVVPMAAKIITIPDTAAMDAQTRTLLDEIKAGEDANSAMEKRLRAFHEEYAAVQDERHIEVVSLLQQIRNAKQKFVTREIEDNNLGTDETVSKKKALKRLIRSLYFRQESDRFHDINPAHKGTFEWIYSEPPPGTKRAIWANFQKWLQREAGLYWISGKAGSGKSTLMKLLGTDDRTPVLLGDWSAGSHLLILSFYFWNPGTPLQKSLEGLLRSIALQVLEECPELAEKMFPNHFERHVDHRQPPSMQELKRAFDYLTTSGLTDASLTPIKLVLLIDGLDEFDAGLTSLTELAAMFTSAAKSPCFKAVISSRPENAFESAFRNCPKLRLQSLTHGDIVKYTNENLQAHPRMTHLISRTPEKAASLVSEIVEASQGVFLWVRLVVRSLLEGLQNHDEIDALTARLRELPPDLENLFQVMIQRVPRRYKRSMSKIFQIIRSVHEQHRFLRPLSALGLKFALSESKEILQSEIGLYTVDKAFEEVRSIEAQIRVSCSGLIELKAPDPLALVESDFGDSSESFMAMRVGAEARLAAAADMKNWIWFDSFVSFTHRTVREYLWKEVVWKEVIAHATPETFDPSAALLQSIVMKAKRCQYDFEEKYLCGTPRDLLLYAMILAGNLEERCGTDQLDMMDALEMTLTTRCGLNWWHTCYRKRSRLWHDNLLTFAIDHGLWRFVQARLRARGQEAIHKPGRPLLDYVCRPVDSVRRKGVDIRITEALLRHGANPNEKFNGFSPWENAWYAVWAKKSSYEELLPVLEILLEYDADPNAYIEYEEELSTTPSTRRRISILVVALKWRDHILDRENDRGSEHETCDCQDIKCEDNDADGSQKSVQGQDVTRVIAELKKRGAKVKKWREVDGIFERQYFSSWNFRARASPVQTQCLLL